MADRISRFFKEILAGFVFVNYSEELMEKLKIQDIMTGVPVPLSKEDLLIYSSGKAVSATKVAENMTFIIGADTDFKYNEPYKEYMKRFFDNHMIEDILKVGVKAIGEENLYKACIHFRAALAFVPNMMEAMFNYARVCRQIYLDSDQEDEIGFFKAEALEVFEKLTIEHPKFDKPYYFLGYMYLNLGLYTKAKLTFEEFLKLSKDPRDVEEITIRIKELDGPQLVEAACNLVISGRYQEGAAALEPFVGGEFDKWWPLHFYLGTAYEELAEPLKAIDSYKRVLKLNASHIETMEGLVRIYHQNGDIDNVDKYLKKIELVEAEIED
ncbi:MAG: hypothetical protein RSA49_04105 [Anaerovoracaceae bacterium]